MTRRQRAVIGITAFAALVLGGCASLPDTFAALAKDGASVCMSVRTMLYGDLYVCRTNAADADLAVTSDGMRLRHRGP